jgi:tRNA threonylcarbamoyladenosine biosynthesis protein TsaB
MLILGLDTCLGACSAALTDGDSVLAEAAEAMTRGHQERLAPMVQALMAGAGVGFSDLDRIAVTVGPGSFTGLRVGLAFAKGLALATGRPCVGVGTLEALCASLPGDGRRAAVIDAGRGQIYLQIFEGDQPLCAPDVLPLETTAARLMELGPGHDLILVGPGAMAFGPALPVREAVEMAAPSPVAVARLGLRAALAPPRPLYLRAPDARVKAA